MVMPRQVRLDEAVGYCSSSPSDFDSFVEPLVFAEVRGMRHLASAKPVTVGVAYWQDADNQVHSVMCVSPHTPRRVLETVDRMLSSYLSRTMSHATASLSQSSFRYGVWQLLPEDLRPILQTQPGVSMVEDEEPEEIEPEGDAEEETEEETEPEVPDTAKGIDEQGVRQAAEAAGLDLSEYDMEQIMAGMKVELEHGTKNADTDITDDEPVETLKIVLAHLKELPDYYTLLDDMEKEGKAGTEEATPKAEARRSRKRGLREYNEVEEDGTVACGFAIHTPDDQTLLDWAADSFDEDADHARESWGVESYEALLDKDWSDDYMTVEDALLAYITGYFGNARSEGHGSNEDLIGTIWIKPEKVAEAFDYTEPGHETLRELTTADVRPYYPEADTMSGLAQYILESSEISFFDWPKIGDEPWDPSEGPYPGEVEESRRRPVKEAKPSYEIKKVSDRKWQLYINGELHSSASTEEEIKQHKRNAQWMFRNRTREPFFPAYDKESRRRPRTIKEHRESLRKNEALRVQGATKWFEIEVWPEPFNLKELEKAHAFLTKKGYQCTPVADAKLIGGSAWFNVRVQSGTEQTAEDLVKAALKSGNLAVEAKKHRWSAKEQFMNHPGETVYGARLHGGPWVVTVSAKSAAEAKDLIRAELMTNKTLRDFWRQWEEKGTPDEKVGKDDPREVKNKKESRRRVVEKPEVSGGPEAISFVFRLSCDDEEEARAFKAFITSSADPQTKTAVQSVTQEGKVVTLVTNLVQKDYATKLVQGTIARFELQKESFSRARSRKG